MIRFRAFTKRYGTRTAVSDLSLEVRAGEVVALLGPNGSGKSTSLNAAAGLLRPSSGEVLVGEPPLPSTLPAARQVLSFLPQKVSFPESLTGREVVEFYRRLRHQPPQRAEEALRLASLNGAAGRPVGVYSGGMTQRLGLAVAALVDAAVLLLDEPTASLDAEGLAAFHDLAERRRLERRALLFSSHQLADVERLADRVVVLVEGRMVADLPRAALVQRLSDRGVLRIRLGTCPSGLLERVLAVAPHATLVAEELCVPGPPRTRIAALEMARAAGGEIRNLSSEEGRLDLLYRDLAEAAR